MLISAIAKGQLAPFSSEGGDRLKVDGPQVTLAPTQVIALGVVLHELGTTPPDTAPCRARAAGSS